MENNMPFPVIVAIVLIILLLFMFTLKGIFRLASKEVSVREKYWKIREKRKSKNDKKRKI